MTLSHASAKFITMALLLAGAQVARGQAQPTKPAPDDKVLFTFTIFGDNKSGGEWLDRVFKDMQKTKPSFVIGMGDHYKLKGSMESFDASVKKAFGHQRLWLTPGDNEDQFYGGKQSAVRAQLKYFTHIGLFDAKGKAARAAIKDSNADMMDYYAQLNIAGKRLHLVSMYEHDSMKMQPSTSKWVEPVLARIAKQYPGEPWIVMAHDGLWWKQYFKPGHAIYSCDLLLGASKHVYQCYGAQGMGANMAFNTSAVGRGHRSWYTVMVLNDKFVLLNMDDSKFAVKGMPGCHVKPFGKPGYDGDPAAWFKKLQEFAAGVKDDWGPMAKP